MIQNIANRAPNCSLCLIDARVGVRKSLGYDNDVSNCRQLRRWSYFQPRMQVILDEAETQLPESHSVMTPLRWAAPKPSKRKLEIDRAKLDPRMEKCPRFFWASHYNCKLKACVANNPLIAMGEAAIFFHIADDLRSVWTCHRKYSYNLVLHRLPFHSFSPEDVNPDVITLLPYDDDYVPDIQFSHDVFMGFYDEVCLGGARLTVKFMHVHQGLGGAGEVTLPCAAPCPALEDDCATPLLHLTFECNETYKVPKPKPPKPAGDGDSSLPALEDMVGADSGELGDDGAADGGVDADVDELMLLFEDPALLFADDDDIDDAAHAFDAEEVQEEEALNAEQYARGLRSLEDPAFESRAEDVVVELGGSADDLADIAVAQELSSACGVMGASGRHLVPLEAVDLASAFNHGTEASKAGARSLQFWQSKQGDALGDLSLIQFSESFGDASSSSTDVGDAVASSSYESLVFVHWRDSERIEGRIYDIDVHGRVSLSPHPYRLFDNANNVFIDVGVVNAFKRKGVRAEVSREVLKVKRLWERVLVACSLSSTPFGVCRLCGDPHSASKRLICCIVCALDIHHVCSEDLVQSHAETLASIDKVFGLPIPPCALRSDILVQ
jgi:hypothetical protein